MEMDPDTKSLATLDAGVAGELARAEIDTLIATARRFPRSVTQTQKRMIDLATLDEEAAVESVYALPRGGKTLEGPSIRFAEMAAQSWGNCRVAARTTVVDRREKYVEAEGIFLDAESNVASLARVRRRIVDSKGRLFSDDMIIVTSNAAQSIARRNAILMGIPKAVWRKAYDAARRVIVGDVKTLVARRSAAMALFAQFKLSPEQVCALLGVHGEEEITQDLLVPLRGMYSALKEGETTVEELLRGVEVAQPADGAARSAGGATTIIPPDPDAGKAAPMASAKTRAEDAVEALADEEGVLAMLRDDFAGIKDPAIRSQIWSEHAALIARLSPVSKTAAEAIYKGVP